MNVYLRDKLLQKLEALSDERGYQILDYVEFLDSKYADKSQAASAAAAGNPLSRFADAMEERMRAGKVSATTIAETMGFMSKAMGVLNGAAAAGKSVATDFMSATSQFVDAATAAANSPPGGAGQAGTSGTSGASGPGAAGSSAPGAPPSAGTPPVDGFTPR